MVRLASGALDTIGLSQLTNGLITLHIIDKMLDVDLHSRTPVRGSRHGDPEEQAAFVIDLNLLLQDWPDEWQLLFVDKATVRRHLTVSARWCLDDDIPGVPQDDEQT